MILPILNSLGPVFLVIALGWALRRAEFLSINALQDINRLIYWVGLPSLLFYKIAGASLAFKEAGDLFLVTMGATGSVIILSYLVAKQLGVPRGSEGTFVQASFRGNLAFVGLPVVVYAFSSPRQSAAAEASALLAFGPLVVVYNVASVLALLASRSAPNARALNAMGRGLITNPLLISCGAGVLYSFMGWPLPVMAERSFAAIGQMALPLALICLGGALATTRLRGRLSWSLSAAVVKVMVMPLVGFGLAWLLGMSSESTRIVLILLACPTAAASYVLVRQLGGDEALASGAILISTLLAAVSLAVILVMT